MVAVKALKNYLHIGNLIENLAVIGVDAFFVYDTMYTLEQSKNIQDFLDKYDIIPLGGGFDSHSPFELSICESTYVRFRRRMGGI